MRFFTSFKEELGERNYSLWAQWLGLLCVPVCIGLGIGNIFHFSVVIVFSIFCLVQGFVVLFVEVPFLLRICPFTEGFKEFIRGFRHHWLRAGFYLLNAVIQYVSLSVQTTSLLAAALLFTIVSGCYALGALTHEEFKESSTLGGDNLAQNIIRS